MAESTSHWEPRGALAGRQERGKRRLSGSSQKRQTRSQEVQSQDEGVRKPGSSRGSSWASPQGSCQGPGAAITTCLKLSILRQFMFIVLGLCRSEVQNQGVGRLFLLEFPGEKSNFCLFHLPGAAHIPWLVAQCLATLSPFSSPITSSPSTSASFSKGILGLYPSILRSLT